MAGKKASNVVDLIKYLKKREVKSTDLGARLWQGLLVNSGLAPHTWTNKAAIFFRKDTDKDEKTIRRLANERSNTETALSSEKVSISKLLLGIRILNPIKVEFSVKLIFKNRVVQHTVSIDNKEENFEELDD